MLPHEVVADESAPPAARRDVERDVERDVRRVIHDPARLAALRATALLDAPAEASFDRIAALAARLLGTPLATVTLVDADRQFYTAGVGLPAELAARRETPLDVSFCRLTVTDAALGRLTTVSAVGGPGKTDFPGALVIPDTRLDPRTHDMASVTQFGVHAYAGVPILLDDQPIGTVCVMDVRPRDWSADDVALLADLGRAATTEIALRVTNVRLVRAADDANEARRAAEGERERATQANRAKAQFLANMSHELRTPLNAIGGYTELLALGIRGPVTEAQRADLERIRRSQQHLLGLITDVLNFAKLEAGRVEYDLRDVPLALVLEDVELLVGPQARSRGLSYDAPAPDGALAVRADRDKLQQIVVNLLTNAVKFTDAPGAVTVRCAADPADATRVLLAVRDTGIGIPADRLAAIFEPFVQVDARLTRSRDGTGLGLAISRDLARGMGGELTVESAVGEGSTFTLALPKADG